MRCIKCLCKNLTIRRLSLVFVPVLSLFGLLFLSSSASAVTSRHPSSSVDLWIGSRGQVAYPISSGFTNSISVSAGEGDLFRMKYNFGGSGPKGNAFALDYGINYGSFVSYNLPVFNCPTPNETTFYFDTCDIYIVTSSQYDKEIVPIYRYYYNNGEIRTMNPEWSSSEIYDSLDVTLSFHITGRFLQDTNLANMTFNQRLTGSQSSVNPYYFSVSAGTLYLFDEYNGTADALQQVDNSINEQTEQQKQYHDEEKQGLEDAQSDTNDASNEASEQAESSGTTLLQAFIDFVGAITGSSPSNCLINANLGNLDLGNIDLCQVSPPPAFQVISSIVLIGFFVPLAVHAANLFLKLIRSFQR